MPPFTYGRLSRSSSAILSGVHLPDHHDGTSDDMSIAQGLLKRPRIPRHEAPLTGSANLRQEHDGAHREEESIDSAQDGRSRRAMRSSNTWTSSSGDILAEHDEIEERAVFVQEYNRLAEKHGVRIMVIEDYEGSDDGATAMGKPSSWFSRKILRRTSSTTSVRTDKYLKHRRSISDLSLRLKLKKDKLKDKGLQELVRLCGSSLLYLPGEYAAGSLTVPTCLRATAQYLVQHAPTSRGAFRIPGSHHIIEALYNHYCSMDEEGESIASTVRYPTLPEHIKCDVHDVASTFKKLLSGLPGGILGSLPLFDALVAIQGQLHGDPEFTRTKQSKVRARLIALAVSTLRSKYRRELVCAVFGLLCMIGRTAETTRREDDQGRPLPTADLMGYAALGIVFGPLLVGDLLDNYSMHLANPHGGLVLLPVSPPKTRKEKKKKRQALAEEGTTFHTHVDKIKVANGITEMLITHWRDVVRHMRSLAALKPVMGDETLEVVIPKPSFLRPSASETFALRKPPDWDNLKAPLRRGERSESPTPARRIGGSFTPRQSGDLVVKKQRSRPRPKSGQNLSVAKSMLVLSPTVEEQGGEDSLMRPSNQQIGETWRSRKGSSRTSRHCIPAAPPHTARSDRQTGAAAKPHARSKKSSIELREKSKKPVESIMNEQVANPNPTTSRSGSNSTLCKHHAMLASPHSGEKSREAIEGNHAKASKAASPKGKPPKSREKDAIRSVSKGKSLQGQTSGRKPLSSENPKPNETPVKPSKHRKHHLGKTMGSLERLRETKAAGSLSLKKTRGPQEPLQPSSIQMNRPIKASSIPPKFNESYGTFRRVSASEPGRPRELRVPPRRRPSKSFQGGGNGTVHLITHHFTRDPLDRVSHEEDMASLAALAGILESTGILSETDTLSRLENDRSSNNRSSNNDFSGTDENTFRVESRHQTQDHQADTPMVSREKSDSYNLGKMIKPAQSYEARGTVTPKKFQTLTATIEHQLVGGDDPKTPQTKSKQTSLSRLPPVFQKLGDVKSRGQSGGSVKALAAKFANFNDIPSEAGSKSPLKRSPQKPLSEEARKVFESPRKESIVSPYTTNSPSPSKLQKSTLQSKRKPLSFNPVDKQNEALATSPTKAATPRRLLISSIGNTRPLRQIAKSAEEPTNTSGTYSVNSINPYAVSLRSVEFTSLPPADAPFMESFDGPSKSFNHGKSLPQVEQPPVAQHIQFPRPASLAEGTEAEESILANSSTDIFLSSVPGRQTNSPISRSTSVLHTQIRSLQAQVDKKNEDIRRLRQQLDARGNFDIGTLSEHLRDAKREIQIWKTRAELAEKQVEILSKLPQSRNNSARTNVNSLLQSKHERVQRSSTQYTDSPARPSEDGRSIHGMDGAGDGHWGSDDSNDTVIRETTGGVEFSSWMQKTMNTLGSFDRTKLR
ncbi:hypothetical protein BGZ60DRAFT_528362 [Tricladium varicosporioides]|nr:hypothetical protein BGZ60DRAFT_528362 [Hymenoscyphus varicosporioides]